MIKVICKTNLDLRGEEWPTVLPAVPRIGERIQSGTKHHTGFILNLEVVQVTYEKINETWVPVIELHLNSLHRQLPSRREGVEKGSIRAFYEWYAPAIGTHYSAFI